MKQYDCAEASESVTLYCENSCLHCNLPYLGLIKGSWGFHADVCARNATEGDGNFTMTDCWSNLDRWENIERWRNIERWGRLTASLQKVANNQYISIIKCWLI